MATQEAKRLAEDGPFLTESGLQTTLIFKKAQNLPEFSTHELLFDPKKEEILASVRRGFYDEGVAHGFSFIIDMDTWRASSRWYKLMKVSEDVRCTLHKRSLGHAYKNLKYIEDKSGGRSTGIVTGTIGPAGDAYKAGGDDLEAMREYHREQLREMKSLGLGLAMCYTFNSLPETLGIALEAKACELPVVISFVLGRNGKLSGGETLQEAVETIDREAEGAVLFFMINCVHPTHVRKYLEGASGKWLARVRGVRGNASSKTHEELDGSDTLDEGDPIAFAEQLISLRDILPELTVFGGCCGTGNRHCEEVAKKLAESK